MQKKNQVIISKMGVDIKELTEALESQQLTHRNYILSTNQDMEKVILFPYIQYAIVFNLYPTLRKQSYAHLHDKYELLWSERDNLRVQLQRLEHEYKNLQGYVLREGMEPLVPYTTPEAV